MKVVVDALAARTGGGVTYLRSLLGAVLAADAELRLDVVCGDERPFAALDPSRFELVAVKKDVVRRLIWEQRALADFARERGADVLFSPSEVAPVRSRVPVVLGLQNPNLYERPVPLPLREEIRTRILLRLARRSVRGATGVVYVSEPFRVVARARLGVTAPVERVVEPGIDPAFVPRADAPPQDPYVLCVADGYAYKNLPRLVGAFARLSAARPDLRLVLVGRDVDRRESARVARRIAELGVGGQVELRGSQPLEEMPSLYRGAACFAFPSLLESFGFPPLEAMACGVPVACARASVLPHVCGDGAEYFDPYDETAMAGTIARLLDDAQHAREVVERGLAHVRRYDWLTAGRALAEVFRAVVRR